VVRTAVGQIWTCGVNKLCVARPGGIAWRIISTRTRVFSSAPETAEQEGDPHGRHALSTASFCQRSSSMSDIQSAWVPSPSSGSTCHSGKEQRQLWQTFLVLASYC